MCEFFLRRCVFAFARDVRFSATKTNTRRVELSSCSDLRQRESQLTTWKTGELILQVLVPYVMRFNFHPCTGCFNSIWAPSYYLQDYLWGTRKWWFAYSTCWRRADIKFWKTFIYLVDDEIKQFLFHYLSQAKICFLCQNVENSMQYYWWKIDSGGGGRWGKTMGSKKLRHDKFSIISSHLISKFSKHGVNAGLLKNF